MIEYSLEKHKFVISKDPLTGFWEMECRYCTHVAKTISHAEAIKEMDKAEVNHRGRRS